MNEVIQNVTSPPECLLADWNYLVAFRGMPRMGKAVAICLLMLYMSSLSAPTHDFSPSIPLRPCRTWQQRRFLPLNLRTCMRVAVAEPGVFC